MGHVPGEIFFLISQSRLACDVSDVTFCVLSGGGGAATFFTFLNVSRYGHGYGSRVLTMVCQE